MNQNSKSKKKMLNRISVSRLFAVFILFTVILFIQIKGQYGTQIGESVKLERRLAESFILFGILETILDEDSVVGNRSDCFKDSKILLEAISSSELWALKVLDSSGNPASSFVYGQNFWIGSKTECNRINRKFRINIINPTNPILADSIARIPVEYVSIFANYSNQHQYTAFGRITPPLHIGICAPKACTITEVKKLAQHYFHKKTLKLQKLLQIDIEIAEVRKSSWINFIERSETKILISVIATFIFLFIFMNIFQGFEGTIFRKISKCFSIRINFCELVSTHSKNPDLNSIDAIRTITCALIMGGHLIYFSTNFNNNGTEMIIASYQMSVQLLYMLPYLVDTFFHLGGMVLVYNFLRNKKQIETIKENGFIQNFVLFFKLILNRYLRLTPALILTMGLSHLTALYLKDISPYYVSEDQDLYCKRDYWWRNLFYIQSYFKLDDMCLSWVWYLSCDMQYYLLVLFGLFVYAKGYSSTVSFSYLMILFLSVSYSFYLSSRENYKFYLENFKKTENSLYKNPLIRIIPYLSGVCSALTLRFFKVANIPAYLASCWCVGAISIFSTFSTGMIFRDYIPQFVFSINNSIMHFGVPQILIGFIVYLTYFGKGGFVGKFLSQPIFVHLTKVTYMMYLIEPIIIYLYRGSNESPASFNFSTLYVEWIGIVVISYLSSIVLTLIFEIPYIRLSKEVWLKKS